MADSTRSQARHGQCRQRGELALALLLWAGAVVVCPTPAQADRAVCREAKCSASASVRFKVVIPPTLGLRSLAADPPSSLSGRPPRDGTVRNVNGLQVFNNTRQSVSYTIGAYGQITVSLP